MKYHNFATIGITLLILCNNSVGQSRRGVSAFFNGPAKTTECSTIGICVVKVKANALFISTTGDRFKCEVAIESPAIFPKLGTTSIRWQLDESLIDSKHLKFKFRQGDGIKFVGDPSSYSNDFPQSTIDPLGKFFEYQYQKKTPGTAFPYEINVQYWPEKSSIPVDCDPIDPLVVNQG
jgi:hypothetical protein